MTLVPDVKSGTCARGRDVVRPVTSILTVYTDISYLCGPREGGVAEIGHPVHGYPHGNRQSGDCGLSSPFETASYTFGAPSRRYRAVLCPEQCADPSPNSVLPAPER